MAFKISLRVRLSFWYTATVALTLAAFGAYTYFAVSRELHANLDSSLGKVAITLDYIITKNQLDGEKTEEKQNKQKLKVKLDRFSVFRENEKNRIIGPFRPSISKQFENEEDNDIVLSAVYEHILLNPKNYYIQIADTNYQVIWKTKNLQGEILPTFSSEEIENNNDSSKIKQVKVGTESKTIKYKSLGNVIDSIFHDFKIDDQQIRLFTKRSNHAIITVGYSKEEITSNLNQLFSILLIAFPLVILISSIGGMVLSKLSLRQIDEITQSADEITATNLSKRLPTLETKDEVGHLTRTLNRMIERLEKQFNQIKQFTSDVSHELKTPLTILRGELELALHHQKSTEDYEILIASALEEVVRLTNVVETLLELSRAETGQINMNLSENNLSRLITDIVDDILILAELKEITVTYEIASNVIINYDQPRVHQAMLNVMENAVKYTPSGGEIQIQLNDTTDGAEIIVSDSGVGIPEESIPFIFDRFYRVDKARSHYIQGFGLGLSIVKWIVDAHNGEIFVNSKVDEGTEFRIFLPNNFIVL
jgi:heavy metal sensor kinase